MRRFPLVLNRSHEGFPLLLEEPHFMFLQLRYL